MAMQVCAQLKKEPKIIEFIILSNFADLSITAGDFPPISNIIGVKFFAAFSEYIFPILVEPVYIIKSNLFFNSS